jgi:hypothetical protein
VKVEPPAATAIVPNSALSLDLVLGLGGQENAAVNATTVIKIEAGKPVSAQLAVAKLFEPLKGEIRICDPYYGTGSLLRIRELSNATSVRFLTQKPDSKEISLLPKAIKEFVTEHKQFDFRKYAGNDLHDRFVVTADELILIGHGIKDIGSKESFVVRLDRVLAGDVIDTVQQSFDIKWANAAPLP